MSDQFAQTNQPAPDHTQAVTTETGREGLPSHLQDDLLEGLNSPSLQVGIDTTTELSPELLRRLNTQFEVRVDQGLISGTEAQRLLDEGLDKMVIAQPPAYIDQGYLQTGLKGSYRVALPLDVSRIDPYFPAVARVWGGGGVGDRMGHDGLVLGGGSEFVQLVLDKGTGLVPVATIFNNRAYMNTVMPFMDRMDPRFVDQMMMMAEQRDVTIPPYGRRSIELVVGSTIDPESGHDLAAMGSALSKGKHLVSEHASIMVPLKTTALAVLSGDGQSAALHFRGPEQYADYLAGVLTLPEVERTNAKQWVTEQLAENAEWGPGAIEIVQGAVFNTLDYTAVMASRGHAVGWQIDPQSKEMLRGLADWLPSGSHRQVVDSVTHKLRNDPAAAEVAPRILTDIGLKS